MADNRPDGPDLLRPSDHNVNGNGNGNAPGKRPVVTSQDSNVASFLQQHVADLNEQSRDPAVGVKGSAPNFGQFPVPHVLSFQGLFGTFSRVYRPSDEAVKDSLENARYMRNDAGVMECVEARQRCTALLDWHLQPEDENSPEQIELVDQLTKILNRIERFTEYRYNLLHAVWYGRYAIQHRYRWDRIEGNMRVLPKGVRDNPGWIPVNGDKLVFRYDDGQPGNKPDQVGIRVGSRFQARDRINGRWNVEPTERGLAYFLEDWERGLLALHKHTLEDGSWEVGYEAGTIHGVGLRSRIYWDWFQKQEALAFLMEYLERSAGGIEIWHYPMGNAEAEAKARTAAEERIGNQRNIILVPKPMGDDAHAFGVEIVEPGMAGIDALQTILTDYYGHRIKRYILGQTLSSEAQATGLGSGLADLHLDTFLQIIKYDAVNLEETITHQLVKNIKDWNFPAAKDIHIEFKLDVEGTDTAEKLQAWQTAWQMGAKLKESDVMDLIGASVPTEGDNVLEMPEQGGDMGMEGMGGGGDMFGGPGPNGDPQASGIPTEDFDRRDDGPLPPDRDRDTDSVLAELFGEATAEGQTITYVSSNGKWMQQDMPHNTGERARGDRGVIDRNAKQGMLDFDEGKHPRDEGGKFTSGAGGPVPDGKRFSEKSGGDKPLKPNDQPENSYTSDEIKSGWQYNSLKELKADLKEMHSQALWDIRHNARNMGITGHVRSKGRVLKFWHGGDDGDFHSEMWNGTLKQVREYLESGDNFTNVKEPVTSVDIEFDFEEQFLSKWDTHSELLPGHGDYVSLWKAPERPESKPDDVAEPDTADSFTSKMEEKYGDDFYDKWTSEEQDTYADLRLGKSKNGPEDGKQRAPIIPEGGKFVDLDLSGASTTDPDYIAKGEAHTLQKKLEQYAEEVENERKHLINEMGIDDLISLAKKHGVPASDWQEAVTMEAKKKVNKRPYHDIALGELGEGVKSKNAKPNFDEQEHPRDEDGKFSSTPVGTKRPDTEAAGDYWEKVEDHTDIDESGNPDAGLWKRRKGAQTTRKELGEKRDRLKLRIDDKSRQKAVTSAVNNLLSRMSRKSRRRLNYAASTFHFHEEPERMIGQLSVMAHTEGASPVAAFDADNGTLHLVDSAGKSGKSGATLGKDEMMRQTYAHAMSHAIDGRFRNERLSNRDAWVDAWENDLSSGQLTDHGSRNTREGFAEFGRLVFSSDVPEDRIAELFPNCWKFWKGEDLV